MQSEPWTYKQLADPLPGSGADDLYEQELSRRAEELFKRELIREILVDEGIAVTDKMLNILCEKCDTAWDAYPLYQIITITDPKFFD